MVTTEVRSDHGARIHVNRQAVLEQGGLQGVVSIIQENPLLAAGAVIGVIVLLMVFSGGDVEEEIAERTAKKISEQVT